MSIANPASDLSLFLSGRTLGGVALVPGTNLFVGQMRAEDQTPSPSAFLLNTGGPGPTPYIGGNRIAYFRPTVQVVVRGAARKLEAGETFARALFSVLLLAEVPKAGGGTYTAILARDSAPSYMGEDDSRRPIWVMNFECQYKGTAG